MPFHWHGKESLFRGECGMLLGPFFRACGGVPIARSASTGAAINRLAQRINAADFYWLALAPEGTRPYRDSWRSGFYPIALTARVPLCMACIAYRKKEMRMADYALLSDNAAADLARIRDAYFEARRSRSPPGSRSSRPRKPVRHKGRRFARPNRFGHALKGYTVAFPRNAACVGEVSVHCFP